MYRILLCSNVYKDRMNKSILIRKYCNKQFWCVCLISLILCVLVLCSHYSALFAVNNIGVTLFGNYENSAFSQESHSLDFKGNFTETSSQLPPTKVEEKPVLLDRKDRVDNRIKMKPDLDSCFGRYIFVHKLPSRFNDDILKNCSSLLKWLNMCEAIMNVGLGPQVTNSYGILQNKSWFATNQYALDIIFHNRMKQYKCLTQNSSLASAIYVPFYAGLDLGRYLFDGFNTSVRDSAAINVMKWLAEKPEWRSMWGRDHFLVSGRVTWDFMRLTDDDSDWGSKLMLLPQVKNMTMLLIESSPWGTKDFAIPHPTYFHPSSDGEVFQWQDRMRKQERQFLFCFVGAPQPNVPYSIRGEIINQCLDSRKECVFLDCNSSSVNCRDPIQVMKVLQNSIFCLEPPGDSYTRRSTFDSILAGCIPVFFHPGSAYVQFKWYLPKNYTKYSVFIPDHKIRDGKENIKKTLLQISKDKILAMREEVIRLIPKVTFADPRSRLERVEDAFDIAVNGVLERVETIRREMKGGRSSSLNFSDENKEWDSFFRKTSNANFGGHKGCI